MSKTKSNAELKGNRDRFINKSHNSSKINKATMVLRHLSVGAETDGKSVEGLGG